MEGDFNGDRFERDGPPRVWGGAIALYWKTPSDTQGQGCRHLRSFFEEDSCVAQREGGASGIALERSDTKDPG